VPPLKTNEPYELKTATLKTMTSTQKQNFAKQKRIWFCTGLANGLRYPRVGGRG